MKRQEYNTYFKIKHDLFEYIKKKKNTIILFNQYTNNNNNTRGITK